MEILTLCAATRFSAFSFTFEALLANIFDNDLMTSEMYDSTLTDDAKTITSVADAGCNNFLN